MGLYKKEIYERDKYGKWRCVGCEIEKVPHDIGTWVRNNELETKDSVSKTYFNIDSTRGGLNKKVNKITTYFTDTNEKYVRSLITTSNKLSTKDSEKYKEIKGCSDFTK